MASQISDKEQTEVGPDQFPMYNGNEKVDPLNPEPKIKQGQGSNLNSDTVDGWQVSTTTNPSPNTLVPLQADGTFPASVMPSTGDILARLMAVVYG